MPPRFFQMSEACEHPPLVLRNDIPVALEVVQVDEMQPDVGGAQIPKRDEVVEVGGIADIKARLVPAAPARGVSLESMTREVGEARMIQNLNRERLVHAKWRLKGHQGARDNRIVVNRALV